MIFPETSYQPHFFSSKKTDLYWNWEILFNCFQSSWLWIKRSCLQAALQEYGIHCLNLYSFWCCCCSEIESSEIKECCKEILLYFRFLFIFIYFCLIPRFLTCLLISRLYLYLYLIKNVLLFIWFLA